MLQLRNRFRRRGEATLRPYEILSDDDTILFGAIPCSRSASDDVKELSETLGLVDRWIRYDASSQRIEMPLSAAEEIAEHLTVQLQNGRSSSTHERLEVGVVNLNEIR